MSVDYFKRLTCKLVPLDDNGEKIMEFTKGETYLFVKSEEDTWATKDDNGNIEYFFDITKMFE